MVRIFAVGTLKKGFPLHGKGLSMATYLGEGRTHERFPMIIAGQWYAPMVLNQRGCGLHLSGELYQVNAATLAVLDELESVGKPGNDRLVVQIDRLMAGQSVDAWMFVKDPMLAHPVHSDCLAEYQDRRFISPEQR